MGLIKDRLRALIGREKVIGDIDEEMRIHIEMEVETNISRGMSPGRARRAALRSFGNIGATRDVAYRVRGGGAMESIAQDVKYGWRMLRKNPASTLIIIFILAVGIGANTAIFSVLNSVLLRRLPITEPERVAAVEIDLPQVNLFRTQMSPLQYLDFSRECDAFSSTSDIEIRGLNLTGIDMPQRLQTGKVTASFFPMLGVFPASGRFFHDDEDRYGAGHVAVLSYRLWKQLYNKDGAVIGQSVQMDDESYQIIGVAPRDLEELYPKVDIWVPAAWSPARLSENRRWSLATNMLARLKPGVTFPQAQGMLDEMARTIKMGGSNFGIEIRPLVDQQLGEFQKPFYLLFAAVTVVLLISCVNVTGILLARGSARSREIAVRAALGALRGRIARQLLLESLMIALAGGGLGLLLGVAGTRALIAIAPRDLPRIDQVKVDSHVLLFTLAISVGCGIAFGMIPAIAAAKIDLTTALKEAVRSSAGNISEKARGALVIVEVALSVIVLVAAGLVARSFSKILDVDPGFNAANVITARLDLPGTRYRTGRDISSFNERLLERVSALPDVVHAAIAYEPPLMDCDNSVFSIRNRPEGPNDPSPHADYADVSTDYLRAMGIALVRGRDFQKSDWADDDMKAVIIDERLARRFWPNDEPIGAEIGWGNSKWYPIVGIARTVHNKGMTQEPDGTIYFPSPTIPEESLVVRSTSDQTTMANAVRDQVLALDRNLPLYDVRTMNDRLAQSLEERRFAVTLLVSFAIVAVLLAAVGLYGVIGYSTSRRTREIGIRMAMGARTSDVLSLVVRQGVQLAAAGLVAGLAGAYAINRFLAAMLFGVSPTDAITFVAVPILMLAVALVSSYLPARRAARVDPTSALRSE